MSPFTLSSMLCVTFNISAVAIRASSWVSLSSLFSAPSISFLPISLLRNFSDEHQPKSPIIADHQLTWSSLFNLIGGNRENVEYFGHDFHDRVCHCRGWWHFRIGLKPPKEGFYAFKNINEAIMARIEVLSGLTDTVSQWLVLRNLI
jgi:hypothetical protein